MKNEMTIQQPLIADVSALRLPRPTFLEMLAAWAAGMMQAAHEDVRRYEAARHTLGREMNPVTKARNARLAKSGMLYSAYLADTSEVL